jgi:hypothetical protein
MKFKKLFLGMLAAAIFAGCNNESPIDIGPNDDDVRSGISTTATFQLKVYNPTYAGGSSEPGSGSENNIKNAILLIYKLDGTPEAMGFLANSTDVDAEKNGDVRRVTLKCTSGDKLIYLATNIDTVFKAGQPALSNVLTNQAWVGEDWSGSGNDDKKIETLNVPIWPKKTAPFTTLSTTVPTADVTEAVDSLIMALTGNGNPDYGTLGGDPATSGNAGYLMSNWGNATHQPADTINDGSSTYNYASTCKFYLYPNIEAPASRAATPDITNANEKNAILINIQRAVAKVQIQDISSTVLNSAGTGTSLGEFVPEQKWAVGNINKSTYPFQEWDGSVVKSTRYDDTAAILSTNNYNWREKLDNSRWIPAGKDYVSQNLTVTDVINRLGAATQNVVFGSGNRVLVTENNNKNTFNHYLTFVLFAGRYKPDSYVVSVSSVGTAKDSTAFPSTWPVTTTSSNDTVTGGIDTLYYVSDLAQGKFFLGLRALKQYVAWSADQLHDPTIVNPDTSSMVTAKINSWRIPSGNTQAKLQAYYQGYCFYRVWITDNAASEDANKRLVRRNHIYDINVTKINGPGIGDPNDIIDPEPKTIEPTEESATYVTASINIMRWHVVGQSVQAGLD